MSEPIRMSEVDRKALQALTQAEGIQRASKLLEVDDSTLARAIAGLGVRRATITHIRAKLNERTPTFT